MLDALSGNDYSILLCSHLQKAGVNVRLVVVNNRSYGESPDFEVWPIAPSKSPKTPLLQKVTGYGRYLTKIIQIGRRQDVDLLHFQFLRLPTVDPFLLLILRFMGVKIVYTAHNVLPHEHTRRDYALKGLIYRAAHRLIVHSRYIEQKLLKLFEGARGKTAVIPHGNFDNALPETTVSSRDARDWFGFAPDDDVVLFFGQIREYKGVDLLIEAFESAAARNPKLKLIVAGRLYTQSIESKLTNMVNTHPAKERIVLHGRYIPDADLPNYFAAADVVALPYRDIDHSGVVHLAYSFAKPIIGSNVGDFAETIPHGKAGYILPNNTPACIADTIHHAFANKHKLREMGNYAAYLNQTKYSWGDIAEATKTLYLQTLNQK